MDTASIYYLGTTLLMFGIFVAIVTRTYSKRHRDAKEAPKHRMLDDD